jgi:hypothetical protein
MTKLTWTTEKPSEPGWYWCRSAPGCKHGYVPAIYEVHDCPGTAHEGRLRVGRFAWMDELKDCLWSGPIPTPEEP